MPKKSNPKARGSTKDFLPTLKTNTPQSRSILTFFVLTFALYTPFVVIGAVTSRQLYPGIPVAGLAFICPATAASILVYRENGTAAVSKLLWRSFDYKRVQAKIWYLPIVLMMPAIMVSAYGLMRVMGLPLPTPQLSDPLALGLFLAFFIMALGEELGWAGYIIDPMQDRWNALQASILLGVVWAILHIVPMMQAGRSLGYIAWACLFMIWTRVLWVWLYNNTGKSVFAVTLCHATTNISMWGIFPGGSYYLQIIISLITTIGVVIVIIAWGPQTLARYRLPV